MKKKIILLFPHLDESDLDLAPKGPYYSCAQAYRDAEFMGYSIENFSVVEIRDTERVWIPVFTGDDARVYCRHSDVSPNIEKAKKLLRENGFLMEFSLDKMVEDCRKPGKEPS